MNIADIEALQPHAQAASQLLKTLANPYRLQVLCALAEGELTVTEINQRVPLSQSALSQHLAKLRGDGLVKTRREAQTIFYRLTDGPSLDIIRVLQNHFCA